WSRVEYLGVIPHEAVWQQLSRAVAGLLFLHQVRNYVESLPTKMFEYMAAGIPVLASDYAGWPDIVRKSNAGLLANPIDSHAIAASMRQIIEDPGRATEMGRRGREVVFTSYSWQS